MLLRRTCPLRIQVGQFITRPSMATFKSGFILVFGGPDFSPYEFLSTSRLASLSPNIVSRGDLLRDGTLASESWIEFSDIHDGSYPLDAFSEALRLLQRYRDDFLEISMASDVLIRTLSFFGDPDSCVILMEPSCIALLHELSLLVSITPFTIGTDAS